MAQITPLFYVFLSAALTGLICCGTEESSIAGQFQGPPDTFELLLPELHAPP